MPKIPEIVSFWPAMDAVINDTYKGNIKPADYQAKLDKLVQDTSKEAKNKRVKKWDELQSAVPFPLSFI